MKAVINDQPEIFFAFPDGVFHHVCAECTALCCRGQGFAGIKKYLATWDGKLIVRSGTARLAIVPTWDSDVPLREGLSSFPGAQVQIIIPGKAA